MQQKDEELWCIVYIGCAVKDLTYDEVNNLLITARAFRKTNNITGLAINARNNLLIMAEGSKKAVEENFALAKKVTSMHSIMKIFDGQVPCRMFEDHAFAFKTKGVDHLKELDDFKDEEGLEYFNDVLSLDFPVARVISNFLKNNT